MLLGILSFLLLVLLGISLASFINKIVPDWGLALNTLLGLIIGPIAGGWILYELMSFFPQKPSSFYWTSAALIILFLFLFKFNQILLLISTVRTKVVGWIKDVTSQLSLDGWWLLLFVGLVLIAISTLILFWPSSWSDQLFYFIQAKQVQIARDLQTFSIPKTMTKNDVWYRNNIMIRPGLTMIYSFYFLSGISLSQIWLLANITTFYYWILLILSIFYISYKYHGVKSGLLSVLGLVTIPYLVRFLSMGSKELLIIPVTIVLYEITDNFRHTSPSWVESVIWGLLAGWLSIINFTGIALVFLLGLLLFKNLLDKNLIKTILIVSFSYFIVAYKEVGFLINWIIGGVRQRMSSPTGLTFDILSNPDAKSELIGYGLDSWVDIYLRGKLQAFTHFHAYGFVFLIFFFFLILKGRSFFKKERDRSLMIFIALFFLFVIDLLNLNPHPQGYVSSLNPKYPLLIAPFVVMLVSEWIVKVEGWLESFLEKWWGFLGILMSGVLIISFYKFNLLFALIKTSWGRVVPINHPIFYYRNKIVWILAVLLLGYLAISYILNSPKEVFTGKKRGGMRSCFIYLSLTLIPFLSYFSTEYRFKVFKYLGALPIEKVIHYSGGNRNFYPLVKFLNEQPLRGKVITDWGYYPKLLFYLNRNKYQALIWPNNDSFEEILAEKERALVVLSEDDKRLSKINPTKLSLELIYDNNHYIIYELKKNGG